MEQDSPPKHARSLGERLEQKLETDLNTYVELTQNKLDELANSSVQRLKKSLDTELTAIEGRIQNLKKFTKWTLGMTVLASILLFSLVIVGIGFYSNLKFKKLEQVEKERQSIEAQLKKLPPPFHVREFNGKWYLEAPQIKDQGLTYTRSNGEKGDAVQLIP